MNEATMVAIGTYFILILVMFGLFIYFVTKGDNS